MQDQPCELASALMQPRSSYCSNLQYGLPGGQEYVDVPVHHIWQLLAPSISVKVSGQHHRPLPPSHLLLMLPGSPKHECTTGQLHDMLQVQTGYVCNILYTCSVVCCTMQGRPASSSPRSVSDWLTCLKRCLRPRVADRTTVTNKRPHEACICKQHLVVPGSACSLLMQVWHASLPRHILHATLPSH